MVWTSVAGNVGERQLWLGRTRYVRARRGEDCRGSHGRVTQGMARNGMAVKVRLIGAVRGYARSDMVRQSRCGELWLSVARNV